MSNDQKKTTQQDSTIKPKLPAVEKAEIPAADLDEVAGGCGITSNGCLKRESL